MALLRFSVSHAKGRVVDVLVPAARAADESSQQAAIAERLGIAAERIAEFRLIKRSLDARQRVVQARLRFEVAIEAPLPEAKLPAVSYPSVRQSARRILIVGCGPAGMFAALRCLERGCRPIIMERGKEVVARRFDLAPLLRQGTVVQDSNYCFGEGGAGTFSDGKLYTRIKKRGSAAAVYRTLAAHGAPERILIDARPHIGSNLLPKVVAAMRQSILKAGGEVHFETKVTNLILQRGAARGVVTADGNETFGDAVILAAGHSARDIYQCLRRSGIALQQKPFAMGIRIEHPQELIDSLQYHYPKGGKRPEYLPAASYALAATVNGRGVHSFCMCPGGFIVPAATANDEVAVNGMSLSKRDSAFANSGLVVVVKPEDTAPFISEHGVFAGMAFQKQLETAAKKAGGQGQIAPAQRLTDFLAGRGSADLPKTSYFPGVRPARLDRLMPDWMTRRLQKGFAHFGRQKRGYVTHEALLVGFETRTSAPLRIPRDSATLQHPNARGLFPCGEGAGYAGGIVSAALDGIRCAEAAAEMSQ